MSALQNRVRKLEQTLGVGQCMMHVFTMPDGYDSDAGIAECGVLPAPNDLGVVVRKFAAADFDLDGNPPPPPCHLYSMPIPL